MSQFYYFVNYTRIGILSSGSYARALKWNAPIETDEDKRAVAKFIRKKHPFSKCEITGVTAISEGKYLQLTQP